MLRKPVISLLVGHPFELLIALWAFLSGFPLAAGLTKPSASLQQLNPVLLTLFGLVLAAGGVAVVIGLVMFFFTRTYTQQIVGMRVEQGGWIGVGSAVATLTVLIISLGAPGSFLGLIIFFMIALACFARYISLRQVISSYGRSLTGDIDDAMG